MPKLLLVHQNVKDIDVILNSALDDVITVKVGVQETYTTLIKKLERKGIITVNGETITPTSTITNIGLMFNNVNNKCPILMYDDSAVNFMNKIPITITDTTTAPIQYVRNTMDYYDKFISNTDLFSPDLVTFINNISLQSQIDIISCKIDSTKINITDKGVYYSDNIIGRNNNQNNWILYKAPSPGQGLEPINLIGIYFTNMANTYNYRLENTTLQQESSTCTISIREIGVIDPDNSNYSDAKGVSDNGNMIVGSGNIITENGNIIVPFYYDTNDIIPTIFNFNSDLSGSSTDSEATCCNYDGSIIGGTTDGAKPGTYVGYVYYKDASANTKYIMQQDLSFIYCCDSSGINFFGFYYDSNDGFKIKPFKYEPDTESFTSLYDNINDAISNKPLPYTGIVNIVLNSCSGDGNKVCGFFSCDQGQVGYIYDIFIDDIIDVGNLGEINTNVYGMSPNGNEAVGNSVTLGNISYDAFLYKDSAMSDKNYNNSTYSVLYDTSVSGEISCGYFVSTSSIAYAYAINNIYYILPTLDPFDPSNNSLNINSGAYACSYDGRILAGISTDTTRSYTRIACYWEVSCPEPPPVPSTAVSENPCIKCTTCSNNPQTGNFNSSDVTSFVTDKVINLSIQQDYLTNPCKVKAKPVFNSYAEYMQFLNGNLK